MNEKHIPNPIILISQRVDYLEDRNETRDSIDQGLSRWVTAAQAIPVSLPNILSKIQLIDLLTQIQPAGIILSGGNNIGEYCERDQTEKNLLDWAKLNKIPVLGICRGMQFIGVWSGAALTAVKGHTAVKHEITGTLNAVVNSYHDFSLDKTPDGFSPLAFSQDGHLEAMKSNSEWPCEAWMWHPERENFFDSKWLMRFRTLMKLS